MMSATAWHFKKGFVLFCRIITTIPKEFPLNTFYKLARCWESGTNCNNPPKVVSFQPNMFKISPIGRKTAQSGNTLQSEVALSILQKAAFQ